MFRESVENIVGDLHEVHAIWEEVNPGPIDMLGQVQEGFASILSIIYHLMTAVAVEQRERKRNSERGDWVNGHAQIGEGGTRRKSSRGRNRGGFGLGAYGY